MSKEISQVFSYNNARVRIAGTPENPLFVAKDVCDILGISNSRDAIGRLDEDEKRVVSIDTPGGVQQLQVVTESGLYSLILGSRKPEAKKFKRWVTHEVLPSIRKTGSYSVSKTPAEILLAQAQMLVEQERRLRATESKMDAQEQQIARIEARQVGSTEGACEYYSVVAYCKLKSIRCDTTLALKVGKKAATISKQLGAHIGSVPDARFAKVNTYHVDVLDAAFEALELTTVKC